MPNYARECLSGRFTAVKTRGDVKDAPHMVTACSSGSTVNSTLRQSTRRAAGGKAKRKTQEASHCSGAIHAVSASRWGATPPRDRVEAPWGHTGNLRELLTLPCPSVCRALGDGRQRKELTQPKGTEAASSLPQPRLHFLPSWKTRRSSRSSPHMP